MFCYLDSPSLRISFINSPKYSPQKLQLDIRSFLPSKDDVLDGLCESTIKGNLYEYISKR